jgi:undecaprenyl diphosphate synthase
MDVSNVLVEKYGIDLLNVPHHIAIIMDGNGRWAKKRLMPRNFGHKQGQKQLKNTLKDCVTLGVKVLSVYVFSTENWRRPNDEVSFLLKFLKSSIQAEINELHDEGVRLKFCGDLSKFDARLCDDIRAAEQLTNQNKVIQLNIMLNYGARREIMDAMIAFHKSGASVEELTESMVSSWLYTHDVPDPDILIRTGGDERLSNFMLWQCAYSEFFFLDTFWPDFNMDTLCKVISSFQKRDRRYGGLSE